MHYYLLLGEAGPKYTGTVYACVSSPNNPSEEELKGIVVLEIPQETPILAGYRYLGPEVEGLTVLGSDYMDLFEAYPAPDCVWDGEKWVCPNSDTSVVAE